MVYINNTLANTDPTIAHLIAEEDRFERDSMRLIASENYASRAVMEALGSCLTNKYSEGYVAKRYYEGQRFIDQIEEIAITRLKGLFKAEHVNVQPYSGSPANLAVYLAFCHPGDCIMGLALSAGGHLTHGHTVSIAGKYFRSVPYGVRNTDHHIDMEEVRKLALQHRPKILWCGTTAYPRTLDFAAFRQIADEVGALLVADIAHIAGLVCTGIHPSPIGIADVVTSTTHKSFRGPRGGMIFCKKEHAAAIDQAVFPGLQGGPHNHVTAGIAVAALEASQTEFKQYAKTTVDNAQILANALMEDGFNVITGGTDNHLLVVDLTSKNISGKAAAKALDRAGIVLNYNTIPFDPRKPSDPSGIRIGTPAVASRGMGKEVMLQLAKWIARVIASPQDPELLAQVAGEVKKVCQKYPAPGLMV
ncbi:serine hydroxymethyltransferase [Pajaroellobacter abortibovis]|uniref:Serine hydroxymethyltransferase n=1 Tax=Pajaroellobacter abortibovis TaxID=1882918 RepID=A0A1L6MZA3_9BACT|nr:serine hydroxymethyltransferase [Pajaroellobacter abortibovis]